MNASSKTVNSYQLTPQQLKELHKKYGRPGEISPGRPAPKKRNEFGNVVAGPKK